MSEEHDQRVSAEEKDARRKSTSFTSLASEEDVSYYLPEEDVVLPGKLQHAFIDKTPEQQEIVIEVDEADIEGYAQLEGIYDTSIDSSFERQEIVIELDGADEINEVSYDLPPFNPPPKAYFHESSETFVWKVGDVIDEKYEVREVVGQGGMGVVYKVRHREWNIDLAVKVPISDSMSHDLIKARFIREAQIWVDLGLHPNIVQCWYVRELEGVPCVFMDYLEGGSLKDWMRQGQVKQGEWEKILDITIQVCDGLDYAHQHGVDAHRDVKPGNLLMTSEGELRVTDFGIVKYQRMPEPEKDTWKEPVPATWSAEGTLTVTGADLGTPEYSAPEQWGQAKHADARSDIYALGGILFEMCCGRRAFDDRLYRAPAPVLIGRHLFSPVPDPKTFDQHIPDSLTEVIVQCLAKDPDERPDSMMELRERLVWIYHEITGKVYWRDVPQAAELRSSALNNRAISLLDLNKKQEALSTFQEALQLDAHHPESVYNLSLLEWRDHCISDREAVQRLKEAKQASWRAGLYLGFVHLERASADEAERELTEALHQHPHSESGQAWRALGDALMALEKFVDAEVAYQKVLTLMPGDKIARRNLMLAKQRTRYHQNRLLFPWPRCLQTFVGYREEASLAALSPNGRFALIGNDDEIRLWDLVKGRFFWTLNWVGYQNSWIFQGFAQSSTDICITPDATLAVAGGSYEPTIQLWDMRTGHCVRMFKGHSQGIHALTLTPDGHSFISGSLDTTLRLWDLTTGKCLRIFRGHDNPVTAVSMTFDGKFLISGAGKVIRVWDLLTGQYVRRFRGHKDTITALAVTRSHRMVVSGSRDATLGVWQLSSGRRLQTFIGHTAPVTAIALSPDDSLAISSSEDQTLRVWDMEHKKCLRVLTGHTNTITSLAVSPDGRCILSVSRDRTLRVWELDTGKCLQTVDEFTYALEAVELTPDGQQILVGNHEELRLKNLATGGYQQTFTLYKEDTEHIIQQLERLERKDDVTKMERFPSGEAFLSIQGNKANTSRIQVTADGRFAITGGQNATLSLWDVARNNCCLWIYRGTDGLQVFKRNKNWMKAAAISQDARLLLSGWFDSSVRVWDPSTTKCLRVLKGHTETVAAVAITLDGRFGVSGSFDATVRLWDLATGECLSVFEGHNGTVSAVAISPDGRYILSGSTDKTLRLWEGKSGKCLRIFEGHRDGITTIAISANGQYAFSRSADKTFRLWVLDTGEQPYRATLQVCRQQEHQEAQMFRKRFLKYLNRAEVAISSGKTATAYTFLALARSVPGYERDPKALALNSTLGSVLQRKTLRAGRLLRTFEEHQDVVNAIAETPDGKFAISGSRDRTLKLWTLSTETCLRTLEGHTNSVSCVAVTPDRHFAISGSWDETLRVWALATGECLKVLDEHEDYVRAVAITPEGRFAVSGSSDRTLRLWSLVTAQTLEAFQGLIVPLEAAYKAAEFTTAKSLRVFRGHTSDVDAVAISADGQFAVSGGWDNTLRLWSLSTGKCLRVFQGHEHYVTSVVITVNGRFAISGSRDMTLRLWSLSRGKCLRVFEGHTDYVNAVALTSDGRFILSGSRDHTLRLWHLATGKCLQVFDRHEGSVEAVAMTPDGRFVLSGGRDNTLRLWEFDWKLAPVKKIN